MSEINVKVHCPAGTEVRTYLDDTECAGITLPSERPVKVMIEQQADGKRPSGWELYRLYFSCIVGRKIRYGVDVPSPFRASFEGIIAPGTEGTVSFSLVCMEGRYRIVPDRECFVKDSVKSYEINDDSRVWSVVLCTVLVPLLIVFVLALTALWNGDVPQAARVGFGIGYCVIMIGALAVMFGKVKKKRKYTT